MAVLTATARLANKLAFDLGSRRDAFTICNLWLTDVRFNTELTAHTVDDDIEVQLTHTGYNRLAGLFVCPHAERGIFLSELTQRNTHLFLIRFRLGLHRDRDHRFGELHSLKNDDIVSVTQCVTSGDILQANSSCDIARENLFDLFAAI